VRRGGWKRNGILTTKKNEKLLAVKKKGNTKNPDGLLLAGGGRNLEGKGDTEKERVRGRGSRILLVKDVLVEWSPRDLALSFWSRRGIGSWEHMGRRKDMVCQSKLPGTGGVLRREEKGGRQLIHEHVIKNWQIRSLSAEVTKSRSNGLQKRYFWFSK